MNFLKQLVCVFSILLCIISCDIITQNNEDGNIDWSKGDYAFIEMENYPEWESGIITKDHNYLLAKIDTSNNGYIGYINSQAFESDGIALFFDEDLELQSFATKKGVCYINRNEEQLASLLLVTENENTIFDNIELPSRSTNYAPTNKIETRSSSNLSIIKGVAEGVSDLLDIVDLKEGTEQLLDGNWNDSNLNFLEILAGSAIKNPFKGLALDALFKNLEEAKKAFDQMGQIIFLGDCQIAIRQTKIGLKNFKLDVTVSGFESLPPVNFKNGQTKSIVLAGIAINQLPHMTYSSNERIIQTWVVDGNGTNSFEFELPKEVTYYATPYLLPTDGQTRFASNIRYGNTIKLHYFNGVVDEFKQLSYSENGDKYIFKCHAHAICNTKDDEFWKLYYEDDNGEKVFFDAKTYEEPSVAAPNSAEFEFEIELESNLFKDGKKDIKLGVATFTKNYFIMLASDPQIFELNTIRKRLKKYNSHHVLYYDEKGRVIRHVDTRHNYGVEIKYNDTNNSASIYEDGEYSGSAQISNGLVRSIRGESLSYDSKNNLIKSGNSSHTWSNGNITRSSRNYSDHTEYSNFTYGTQVNKLNIDIWASYNCYFPTYYVYFPHKNITANLPISRTSSFGKATYTYKFDEDGYVTKATEHFTTNDGESGTETFTFEYETY